jgi:ATP-dependent exoDNAse (exonuclease V) beta subunit
MLPDETDNQSKFEEIPIPAQETDDVFQGVYTYKAYTGKAAEAEPEMADPVRIADIIERLVGRDDYLIKGSNDKESRPIRYSDFMVITSAKAKLAPIMAELDERGIPTRVEGNVPFEKNEALQEMYKVYAAIAGPNDIMALYGALNGKILGLSKAEIASFKADGGYISTKDIDVEKKI